MTTVSIKIEGEHLNFIITSSQKKRSSVKKWLLNLIKDFKHYAIFHHHSNVAENLILSANSVNKEQEKNSK